MTCHKDVPFHRLPNLQSSFSHLKLSPENQKHYENVFHIHIPIPRYAASSFGFRQTAQDEICMNRCCWVGQGFSSPSSLIFGLTLMKMYMTPRSRDVGEPSKVIPVNNFSMHRIFRQVMENLCMVR